MANANHKACKSKINTIRLEDIELSSINDLPTLAEYSYKVFVSRQNHILTPDECEWVKQAFYSRDTQDKLMYSIASKLCIQPSENTPRDIFYQILLKGLEQLGGVTHG